MSKTPVIRPGHAEGVFRIEAEFTQQSPVVLPGMSGVARLELEGQSVASVWGRHLIDWVKLKAWSLGFA